MAASDGQASGRAVVEHASNDNDQRDHGDDDDGRWRRQEQTAVVA